MTDADRKLVQRIRRCLEDRRLRPSQSDVETLLARFEKLAVQS